jgi:hypothetical protein
MGTYRPLRFAFFIYDSVRLVVMISLLTSFGQPGSPPGGGVFPYVFYAVPNSLFPLMSFFLWVKLGGYKPFIALYMAGKTLVVVSALAWLVFSFPRISASFFEAGRSTFIVAGTVLLLSAGDALSVLGGAVLRKHILNAALPREPGHTLVRGAPGTGTEVPEDGDQCV